MVLTAGGLCAGRRRPGTAGFRVGGTSEARVLGTSVGVLLAASGVLLGQWVATGSRSYHALGGLAMTSMAVMFGWVAFFGQASGFSGGASVGGIAVGWGGGVTAARIAFGIASVLTGLASLWAWRQVLRHAEIKNEPNDRLTCALSLARVSLPIWAPPVPKLGSSADSRASPMRDHSPRPELPKPSEITSMSRYLIEREFPDGLSPGLVRGARGCAGECPGMGGLVRPAAAGNLPCAEQAHFTLTATMGPVPWM